MKSRPDPVDVHVGSKLRLRRTLLGMSQEKLGEAVSLTFQQIQKYERGTNRIGASRLHQLARVLEVPVAFFFEDTPSEKSINGQLSEPGQESYESEDHLTRRETLELVRAYYRIDSPAVRKRVFELVKSLGGGPGVGSD